MSAALFAMMFAATRRMSFRILGLSRASISFRFFQMMRSVIIFRHFFASLRSNQIPLLHSLFYIHFPIALGCSQAADILRGSGKLFVISLDISKHELMNTAKNMLREPKPCGRRFPNTVLHTLAARYARSQAGRTGETARDLILDYEDLLAEAHAGQGDARVCAERDLRDAEHDALLEVERHRRTGKPQCVRFPAANEARLFAKLGLPAPAEQRCQLAAVFEEAAERGGTVPEPHRCAWVAFCRDRAAAALSGASLQPLDRENVDEIREVLALLPRLLSWEGESMIRFASQVLCRDSKRLEQLRGKLEGCLERIAERASDVGILDECDNTKSGVILSAAKDLLAVSQPQIFAVHLDVRSRTASNR